MFPNKELFVLDIPQFNYFVGLELQLLSNRLSWYKNSYDLIVSHAILVTAVFDAFPTQSCISNAVKTYSQNTRQSFIFLTFF
jgi:hypothetical protein